MKVNIARDHSMGASNPTLKVDSRPVQTMNRCSWGKERYLQRIGAYAIFRAWAQRVSFSTITSASTV